ncbi:MAG: hypothetical protein P8J86_01175 [Phycisphaerales bacterium]|nr:hypothetical protein [Phycisphaerales bacterium]
MALAMEGNRMGKDGASGSQSKFDQEYADRVGSQHVDSDQLLSKQTHSPMFGWTISIAIHLGLILIAFFVTWAVVATPDEVPRPVINATFDMPAYIPLIEAPADDRVPPQEDASLPQSNQERLSKAQLQQQAIAELSPERTTDLVPVDGKPAMDFIEQATELDASFGGLRGTNVKRVTFVIDASGSMLSLFSLVIDELARSLKGLDFEQNFGIIFFQEDTAVMVPPRNSLVPATPENKQRALEWIDAHVFPGKSSNPMDALQKAISLNPDVIFLLSDNITGESIYEVDRDVLLKMLEEANPIRPGSDQRVTKIMCIQFLHPDPLNTLEHIADIHGGPGAFKFLDAAELEGRQ